MMLNKKGGLADILIIGFFIFGFILVIFALKWMNNTFFDNIPSVVVVDEEKVYEGTSSGFQSESNGYATKVTIYGGFLYFFPQKVYVSKDVKINGAKK